LYAGNTVLGQQMTKIQVFCDMMPHQLVNSNQWFRGVCCLQYQHTPDDLLFSSNLSFVERFDENNKSL